MLTGVGQRCILRSAKDEAMKIWKRRAPSQPTSKAEYRVEQSQPPYPPHILDRRCPTLRRHFVFDFVEYSRLSVREKGHRR